jgi:processive 1,2-diacylglycerol beta-glucosyltransferase
MKSALNFQLSKFRVLILSASVGGGHMRAAAALERAFLEIGAAHQVRNLDTLEYTTPVLRGVYSKAYSYAARHLPTVTGWLYDAFDRPGRDAPLRLAFNRLNARRFVTMLRNHSPDIAVCTHFLPAEILSWLTASRQLTIRYAVVVTDFDVHAMWLSRYCEHYFVATDEARTHVEALGVVPDRITATGIPIDPVFSARKDKREMRRKHGLDGGRPTILVSGGRLDLGAAEKIMTSLAALPRKVQVVVMCGRQEEARKRMQQIATRLSAKTSVTFKIVGFVEHIDELMAASDLLVGRPGGLTTAEALASGLVFVIVNPIPGQEERNADHLLEESAAIRCNDPSVLAYKIERLLGDTPRFESMKKNVARIARPRAAFDVVDTVLHLGDRSRFFAAGASRPHR